MDQSVNGKRVLIVEDEMMVALLLEDMLTDLGCTVVGPAAHLDQALALASDESFDVAVLDLNIGGGRTYGVADICRSRGLPFLFATGYGSGGLEDRYRDAPTVQKPFQSADLSRALTSALARA